MSYKSQTISGFFAVTRAYTLVLRMGDKSQRLVIVGKVKSLFNGHLRAIARQAYRVGIGFKLM